MAKRKRGPQQPPADNGLGAGDKKRKVNGPGDMSNPQVSTAASPNSQATSRAANPESRTTSTAAPDSQATPTAASVVIQAQKLAQFNDWLRDVLRDAGAGVELPKSVEVLKGVDVPKVVVSKPAGDDGGTAEIMAMTFLENLSAILEPRSPHREGADEPVQKAAMPVDKPARTPAVPVDEPATTTTTSTAEETTRPEGLPPLPSVGNARLLEQVFTHQGFLSDGANHRVDLSYERLEFLGDAYIETICTRFLFERLPHLPVGRLAQLREALVNNKTLSAYSRRYGLGERLRVPTFTKTTKHEEKTLADVFEAYVAAVVHDSDPFFVSSSPSSSSSLPASSLPSSSSPPDNQSSHHHYHDGIAAPVTPASSAAFAAGLTRAEAWLRQLWGPELRTHLDRLGQGVDTHAKQELARRVMVPGVRLEYVAERAPKSAKGRCTFFYGVYLSGWCWTDLHLGSGAGSSKGEATNRAASRALENRPLIDQLVARKRDYDEAVKAKKQGGFL